MTVVVSDHAVLRYLERVKGIDMARIRAEINTPALRLADEFGAPIVIGKHGERYIIRDGVVTTTIMKGRRVLMHSDNDTIND